jgi:hypothetical protein
MELACDILKRTNDKVNVFNDIEIIKDKIRRLQKKITNQNSLTDCFKVINKIDYIRPISLLVKEFFNNETSEEITNAILMSYCISLFTSDIFESYKSRFEQKLILAANKVVIILKKFVNGITEINQDFYKDFYSVIDNYFSLYRIWKSQDSLKILTKLFDQIQEKNKIMNIQLKKGIDIDIDSNKYLIDQLFDTNSKYATRILLHNYSIFNSSKIKEYIWQKIQKCYYLHQDEMFLIIVAELRIKLIPLLNNPSDRKEIYYSIDTEELIQIIRNSKLTNTKIAQIINIFGNKINKINKTFSFNDVDKEELKKYNMMLLCIFESFYNGLNEMD